MNETPNTTPSPQALLAANELFPELYHNAQCAGGSFYQGFLNRRAETIDKHCQSAALAHALGLLLLEWEYQVSKGAVPGDRVEQSIAASALANYRSIQ